MASLSANLVSFPCLGASHGDHNLTSENHRTKLVGVPKRYVEKPETSPSAPLADAVRDHSTVFGVSLETLSTLMSLLSPST